MTSPPAADLLDRMFTVVSLPELTYISFNKGFSNFLQQLYFALLMCLGIYVPAVI